MVSNIRIVDAATQATNNTDVKKVSKNNHSKFWNASSLAPAEEAYDLGFSAKSQKTNRADGPNSASSCSCTCAGTCSGCVQTDSGCTQTQSGCTSTDNRCGHGD